MAINTKGSIPYDITDQKSVSYIVFIT